AGSLSLESKWNDRRNCRTLEPRWKRLRGSTPSGTLLLPSSPPRLDPGQTKCISLRRRQGDFRGGAGLCREEVLSLRFRRAHENPGERRKHTHLPPTLREHAEDAVAVSCRNGGTRT